MVHDPISRQDLMKEISLNWKPDQMRRLGGSLLKLADSLDQGWSNSNGKSIFAWPSELREVERSAGGLAMTAKLILDERKSRKHFLPSELFNEPAWEMMLDLFIQYSGGAKVSTTSICIASGVPLTTALRYIDQLEKCELVKRSASASDKRVVFIELTETGILAMGRCLSHLSR
jgi:predicted transcriptional regulator